MSSEQLSGGLSGIPVVFRRSIGATYIIYILRVRALLTIEKVP